MNKKPKKPSNEKPLSLHPLKFEDVMKTLLSDTRTKTNTKTEESKS
jgi:hypothetical protein